MQPGFFAVLFSCIVVAADLLSDEDGAIKVLEGRLQKAPGLSVEMLKNKIFGAFDNDLEFRMIMHSAAPLYSEKFDANLALQKNLETVFNAESHSKPPTYMTLTRD